MKIGTLLSACTVALLTTLVPMVAQAADPLAVTLTTDQSEYIRTEDAPSQAVVTLQVKNTSALAVTVSFSNGKKYDFVARDASGATVWTWSDGKTFSSTPSNLILAPGASVTYQEVWSFSDADGLPVLDGTYDISGIFTGQYLGRSGAKEATQSVSVYTPDPLVAAFSTDKSAYSRLGAAAKLNLVLTNVAAHPVTVDFQNGQHAEFTARNASGQVVWTWSHGKVFGQDPEQLVIGSGESVTFSGTWSFGTDSGAFLPDGNYTVDGTFLGTYYGAASAKGGESTVRVYTLF
jgi:hypothetical protein